MDAWFAWSETGWRRWLGPDLVIPMTFVIVAATLWAWV